MRRLLAPSLLLVLSLVAVDAGAGPLVGSNNDGNGGFILGNQAGTPNDTGSTEFSNLGWAQPFSLTENVIASSLTVYVNDAFDSSSGGATFSLALTNQIGPGTTGANILFSGSAPFPSTPSGGHDPVAFNLGALALGAGTYYVVLTSSSPVTHIATAQDAIDFDCIEGELCGNVGGWATGGSLLVTGFGTIPSGSFLAFGTNDNGTAPALTAFNPSDEPNSSHADFLLEGQLAVAGVPGPAPLIVVGLGLVGLAAWRRRPRK